MAKTETNVTNLKINRGTYAKIQENISSIGENELIFTEDKNIPVPTANDAGKMVGVNNQGDFELQNPSGITQAQADARYLQLSGGNLTGNINFSSTQKGLSVNNKQILNAGNGSNQPPQLGNIDVSGNLILATDDNGAIIHKISSANRVVLDTGNTSANPTLAGTEVALESLQLNGVKYKNQPSSMQILTTAPSADNTSGIKIVVLSSEPATKYDGYLYLILGS